jgi:hypothetical protein
MTCCWWRLIQPATTVIRTCRIMAIPRVENVDLLTWSSIPQTHKNQWGSVSRLFQHYGRLIQNAIHLNRLNPRHDTFTQDAQSQTHAGPDTPQ